ncbi:F-box protein CPR1-like [Lycium ferocissimum]|uniref:F-box protein CPR1-like n=1 Tax=Lycium ferocissimum TaxID=112874 RepID=UPI002815FFE4|nr:F-box protein CPR1-like [Lycium ferocissimum]
MGVQFREDILMEILSRLPVRYLVRFKCVSKLWKALISDPYFIKKHLNQAKNDPRSQKLLISQYCPKYAICSLYCCPLSSVQLVENEQEYDWPSNSRIIIYCCCTGLAVIGVVDQIRRTVRLMLWNPSTGESIVLPDPEFPPVHEHRLGLGYDSASGDYKILKLRDGRGDIEEPGEILALKAGSWRNIDKIPRGSSSQLAAMGSGLAFLNDAFHWICTSRNYFQLLPRTYSLVSFSISNEVYGEIPLPEEVLDLKGNPFIGVSVVDGMLCVHSNYGNPWKRVFKLWVLKDYGVKESWNALFSIEDPQLVFAVPKYRFAEGEMLYWSLYIQNDGVYSFRTSRGSFRSRDSIQEGCAFTEGLIPPKSLI